MRVRLYDSARKVMAQLALQSLARTDGAGPVLDLGCGPGLIANYLGTRQGRTIHGIDIGARSVDAARASATGTNRFLVYDGEHIPFPADFFDVVLCLEVLEHIQGDRAMLTEVARVLRPGGRLLLSTPNADFADLSSRPHHVRHYTASHLISLVEGAGLHVESHTNRYHSIGSFVDRLLVKAGANVVRTEELDDEALTVASEQPALSRLLLEVYDRVIDPVMTILVWREYLARRNSPGASLVVSAMQPH